MSSRTQRFDIEPSFRTQVRWSGYVLFAFALLALAALIVSIGREPAGVLLLCVFAGGLLFGAALWCTRFHRHADHYSVEMTAAGIRHQDSERAIPWTEITGLRERPHLHRVDLLGPGGNVQAKLEYQLGGFAEALDFLLEHAHSVLQRLPYTSEFKRRFSPGQRTLNTAAVLIICWFSLWYFMMERELIGLLIPLFFVAHAVVDAAQSIQSLKIHGAKLVLYKHLGSKTIDLQDVASIAPALRPRGHGRQTLDVQVTLDDDSTHFIRPPGSDVFTLCRSVRRTWSSIREPRVNNRS